jgi:hypothetical protein
MSRCAKFHHLFDEVGNFCGMSPASISYYRAYREQVRKIAQAGRLEEDFVFGHFTEAPSRLIAKLGAETRTRALNYVTGRLAEGRQITTGDLRAAIKTWQAEKGPQEPRDVIKGKKSDANSPVPQSREKPGVLTIVKTSTPPPLPVETGAPAGAAPAANALPALPGAPGTGQLTEHGLPAAAPAGAGGATARITACLPPGGGVRHPRPGSTRPVPGPLAQQEAEAMLAAVVLRWFSPAAQAAWEQLRESGKYGHSDLAILEGLLEDAVGRTA